MSSANLPIKELGESPLVGDGVTFKSISETVCRVTENKAPRAWWVGFLLAVTFTGVMGASIGYLFWTGVGVYSGDPSSYRNLLQLQPDPAMTRMRIPASANGGGANETLFESVACVADPTACSGAECTPGGIGCPAFRRDAVRMLVTITDETGEVVAEFRGRSLVTDRRIEP